MYIEENCNWTPYGTNPELDKLVYDKDYEVRYEVAEQGYGLDKLVYDKNLWVRYIVAEHGYGLDKLIYDENDYIQDSIKDYLKSHNLTIDQWIAQNPDKCVLDHKNSQVKEITKDFIYKIDDSNKLIVQSQYESIDEFFNSEIDNDAKMNTLAICTVDTKEPLFKVEKLNFNNQTNYKFIVEITTDKGDDFRVSAIIQSQDQLNKLIQQTVDALNLYEQFRKYAEDLENCL